MSSTTWHQLRVDNIFLTIDLKKQTKKLVKFVMHGRLERRYNVIQCTDFDIFHLPNITFWSTNWSCLKVSATVRVRELFLSSTTYASTKDG